MNPQNAGPTPRVPDSGGLGGAQQSAFLTSYWDAASPEAPPQGRTTAGHWRFTAQALESV